MGAKIKNFELLFRVNEVLLFFKKWETNHLGVKVLKS
jgi:hypothetical protein